MSSNDSKPDKFLSILVSIMFAVSLITFGLVIFFPRGIAHPAFGLGAEGWTALFTGTLTISTIALWWATDRSLIQAQISSERQLRAYVSVRVFELGFAQNGVFARGKYMAHNHGQTPAHDVQFFGAIAICPYPLPNDFPIPKLEKETVISVIHPGAEKWGFAANATPFTQQQLNLISSSDRHRVYFFAKVIYVDAFNVSRSTMSCASVFGPSEVGKMILGQMQPPAQFIFVNANQHNAAT